MESAQQLPADLPPEDQPENGTSTPTVVATVLDLTDEEKTRVRRWAQQAQDKTIHVEEKEGKLRVTGIEPESLWWRIGLFEAFGVTNPELQFYLGRQAATNFAAAALPPGASKDQWEEAKHITLALLREMAPRDAIEGLLTVQMIAVHNTALEAMRQALLPEQALEVRKSYMNYATKMLRTFAAQVEALKRHRGGGQQKVVVEHVHVNQGGQALVGHFEAGGRKDQEGRG